MDFIIQQEEKEGDWIQIEDPIKPKEEYLEIIQPLSRYAQQMQRLNEVALDAAWQRKMDAVECEMYKVGSDKKQHLKKNRGRFK